jgi:integrase
VSNIRENEGFMRIRDDFTVFPREMASGKVIWYYQTYDEDGRRTVAHSTGETTRTAAVKKCNTLMREGKLLAAAQARIPTFAEYAQGWWDPQTCHYLKKRLARKNLTTTYMGRAKRMMEIFLIPYFGKMRLDRISEEDIDTWLVNFVEREQRQLGKKMAAGERGAEAVAVKKLKTSYANEVFGILRLMLKQAVKRHIIPFNPAENIEKLVTEPKQVKILTIAEFKEMTKPKPKALPAEPLEGQEEFDRKGLSLELAKMANCLAACTGMRIGEVLGLRGDCVFADFIRVQGQYGRCGYGPTKTRTTRNIPLAPAIMDGLRRLAAINGDGYLFSTDGGETPISRYYFNKYLTMALEEIGIDGEEKKRRNLTPHAWRYFLNTNLRVQGVPDAKVQSVTGHNTQQMTDRYTIFYSEEFSEVRTVQESLLLPEGEEAGGKEDGGSVREKRRPRLCVKSGGMGGKHRRVVGQSEEGRSRKGWRP